MNAYAVPAIVTVSLLTVVIGVYGLRFARTTSDFLVASRSVSPGWNAAAISGEYLSAASFLGVAGLILKFGVDMLWYPVGFAAGYLALLLFVAAPLRRSGAFTLPDFCQARLRSGRLRKLATAFVVLIGWLYLVPQLQGAGLTLRTVTGQPYELGVWLVAVVVTANVALGGMRSITFVQAFQYWLKLAALAVPVMFLLLHWNAGQRPPVTPPGGPVFVTETTVVFERDTTLTLPSGQVERVPAGESRVFPAGSRVPAGDELDVRDDRGWLLPSPRDEGGLFAAYSLILATFLGTMGLPHVLVRFYTNPDGAAARRTTLMVLGLVGLFYLLPTLYGVLGRVYTPQLLMTGETDAVVLVLPGAAIGGVGGAVPLLLALNLSALDVSQVVGLAFAVAASSFCPMLVLGIWWRGLTDVGVAAGILTGGGAAVCAVLVTVLGPPLHGWAGVLIRQPAAWTVPLSFGVMVAVSVATRHRIPPDVGATMLRLHAPDPLRR